MTIEQEEFDLQQAKEELNNIDYMFPYADPEYKEMARKAAQRRVDVLQLRVNRKKNIALNTALQNEAMYEEDKAKKMEDFANMSPLEKAGRATASTMLKIGGGVAKLPGYALQLGGFAERWRTGDKSGNDMQTAGEKYNQEIDDFIAEGTGFDSRMLGEGKSSLLDPSSWNGQDAIASTIRTVEGLQELKGGLWGLGKLGEAAGAGKYLSQAPQAVKTIGEGALFGLQNIPEHSRYYEQTRGEFSPKKAVATGLLSGQAMAWAFALGRGGLNMTEAEAMNFARESVRKGYLTLTTDALKQAIRTAGYNGVLNGVGANGLKELLALPDNATVEQKKEAFNRVLEAAAHETMMGGFFGLQEGISKGVNNRQTYKAMMERGKTILGLGEPAPKSVSFRENVSKLGIKGAAKEYFKQAKSTFSKIWTPEINDKTFDTGVNEYFFGKEGAKLRGNAEEESKLFEGPKQNIDVFVDKVMNNLPENLVSKKDSSAVEAAMKAYKASLYLERNKTILERFAKEKNIDAEFLKEAYDKNLVGIDKEGVVSFMAKRIAEIADEIELDNIRIQKANEKIQSKDTTFEEKQEAAQQAEEARVKQQEDLRRAEMPYTRAEVIEAVRDMVNRKKANSPEQLNRVNELLAKFLVKDRGNKPISVDDAIALLNEVEAELNNIGYSDYNPDVENIVNPKLIGNDIIYGNDERNIPTSVIPTDYNEPRQIGYDNVIYGNDERNIPTSALPDNTQPQSVLPSPQETPLLEYNPTGRRQMPISEGSNQPINNMDVGSKVNRESPSSFGVVNDVPRSVDMLEKPADSIGSRPKTSSVVGKKIEMPTNRLKKSEKAEALQTNGVAVKKGEFKDRDIPMSLSKPSSEPMAVKKESAPKPNVSEKPTGSKKPTTEKSSATQKPVIENKTYGLEDSIEYDGKKSIKELVDSLSDSNKLVLSGKTDGKNASYEISKKGSKKKISVSKDVYDYAKGLEDKKAESTDDGFNGFLKGKQPFEKGAAKKVLNKVTKYDGKTVKEVIDQLAEEGTLMTEVDTSKKGIKTFHVGASDPEGRYRFGEYFKGKTVYEYAEYMKSRMKKNNAPTEVREDADSSAPSAPRKTLSWEKRQEEAAKEIWGEDEPIGNKTVDDSSVSKTRLGGGRIKNYDVVYDSIPRIGDRYERESRDIPAPVEAMMNLTRGGEWFADLEHEVLSGIPDNAIALIEDLRKRIPLVYEKKFADKVINNLNKLEKMVESGDFKRGKIKPISLEELEAQPIKRMPQENVESWREGRELYVADKRETEPSKQSKREYANIARNVAELYREGKITKEQRKYFYDNLKPEYDFNLDVNLKKLEDYQKEIVSREREKLRSSEAFLVQSLNKGLISFNDFVERRRKLSIEYHDSLWKSGILTNGIRRQIVDPNRYKPQLSRTKNKTTNPVTDKELNNFLRGQAKQISKETGLNFKVVDSVDELRKMFPNNDITDTVEGGIHNDTVYLVKGNIDKDRLPLVIAHEVAGHRGVESLFENKQQMDNFFNSLERAAVKDKFIRDAFAEVDRLGYKENRSREAMAKIVEKVRNESGTLKGTAKTFVNFITSRVRRLLRRMGFKNLQLNEAEVYDIAVQALRRTGLKNSNKFFGLDRFLAKDNSSMFSFKQNVQLRPENRLSAATIFSGGGLVEAGLDGIVTNKGALENDANTARVYTDNHGKHMIVGSVLNDADVERLYKEVGDKVDYFHASPVCHNFSRTKNNRSETKQDIQFANATAKAINRLQPKIFTCENASDYKNSKSFQIITKALEENGYKWDDNVYRHDELGGATKRERVIIRAVKEGELPPVKMQTTPQEKSWYEAVKDLIPDAPVREKPFTARQSGLFDTTKIDGMNIYKYAKKTGKPVWISGNGHGEWRAASAEDSAPTVTANGASEDWIIMPNGTAKEVTPKMLARLMGLPENYKLPKSKTLAHQILGNGVPTEMTREVIAPLLLDRTKKNSVDRKLDLNGEKYSPESIENFAEGWFHDAFESDIDSDNGSDTPIGFVKAKVVGSRAKGTNRPDSDLDIVLEYSDPTDSWSEDSVFNILNEKSRELNGVKVDINPIKREDSGTLEDWLERNYNYDKNKKSPSIKDDSLKSLGMSERNGRASWSDSRISNLIEKYGSETNDSYSQAYATTIDPVDFLKLTLGEKDYKELWKRYPEDFEVKDLNPEKLKKESQTPFLIIKGNSKDPTRIIGHEGRHRLLALAKAGIKSVPVVIEDLDTKYSKETMPPTELKNQKDYDKRISPFKAFTKEQMIPIKESNRETLRKMFGGEADIQFSIGERKPRKIKPDVISEAEKKILDEIGEVKNPRDYNAVKKIAKNKMAEYKDVFSTKKNTGYKTSALKLHYLLGFDRKTQSVEKAFQSIRDFNTLQKTASAYARNIIGDKSTQANILDNIVKAKTFEKVYDIISKTNIAKEREIRKDLLDDFRNTIKELNPKKISTPTRMYTDEILGESFTPEELDSLIHSNEFTTKAVGKLRNIADNLASELGNIRKSDIEVSEYAINNAARLKHELNEIIKQRDAGNGAMNVPVEKLAEVNQLLKRFVNQDKLYKESLDTSAKNAAVADREQILSESPEKNPKTVNSRETNSIGRFKEYFLPGKALKTQDNENVAATMGKTMHKVAYEDLLEGQNRQDHYRATGYKGVDRIMESFGKDLEDGREYLDKTAFKVKTSEGHEYEITNNEALAIIANYLDRETGQMIKKAGKVNFYLGEKKDSDYFTFTRKELDDMVNKLTPKQKKAIEDGFALLSNDFLPELNRVYEKLNGVPLRLIQGRYFPRMHVDVTQSGSNGLITRDRAPYIHQQMNADYQGILKQRDAMATPNLNLRGFTDTLQNYTDQASLYIGMAEPLRHLNRIMNGQMKRELTARYGAEYVNRINQMTRLMAGMAGKTEVDKGFATRYLSNLAAAKLTPLSAIKQLTSVPLASSVIPAEYLAKAAISGMSNENVKEMMELDGMILRYRSNGIAGIIPVNAKTWGRERIQGEKFKGQKLIDKAVGVGLNLSLMADKRALGIIYKATKLWAESQGKGSDKTWIENKFMEAVRRTQNTTDLASATGWQMDSRESGTMAFLNMYLNQTQKVSNEFFRNKRLMDEAAKKYGKNSAQYKEARNRTATFAASAALMEAMMLAIGSGASMLFKGKDEDSIKDKAVTAVSDLTGNPLLKPMINAYSLQGVLKGKKPTNAAVFGDDFSGMIPEITYTMGRVMNDLQSDDPAARKFRKLSYDMLSSKAAETSLALGRVPTWFARYPAKFIKRIWGEDLKNTRQKPSTSSSSGSSRLFSGKRMFGNSRTFGGKRMF